MDFLSGTIRNYFNAILVDANFDLIYFPCDWDRANDLRLRGMTAPASRQRCLFNVAWTFSGNLFAIEWVWKAKEMRGEKGRSLEVDPN